MTAPGVSAGSVYVDVEPQTAGFWAAFVAQTTPGAAAAGATLGTTLGAAMAARIRAAVQGALNGLGNGAGAAGAQAGNRFGGLFVSTARARIQAALRSLPEYTINIHARATDAERKMRDLRDQLEALSKKRIGIDISETDARAEVKRLKDELDRLAQSASSPRVRIDAGAASLELRRLEEELDRLDGRRANARVDVDDRDTLAATSRLGTLISVALTLGPAIIPAATAASAAIGGIGLAAVSAAPAVGVLALAFAGIGGAVTALANAEREQAKTGNTAVQQNKSLASTADQVRSAERSLANTRAQVVDQRRRALAQIVDAEKALTRAQRDATEAQEGLNDAREEERRAQEDTAINLKKNAVEQGKIALDIAELRRQLEGFGGEYTANALDEALARQEELAASGRRLAADQQRDQRTGIDGSKRVVEAQQKIADAQDKVTEAVEREAEARLNAASQARQAAFQIAQGEQAVISARRAGAAALSAASATAGSALDKLNDELATLPQSGQAFARFLFGLKPQLAQLREAAADGLLPGAQAGIVALLPYVGGLTDFVGDLAGEIGNLAERAGTALTSPFWRQFFDYIGNDAVPVVRGLATVTGNFTEGLAGLLLGFQPVERQLGGGFIRLSERFLAFSRTVGENKSFQGFIAYAMTEGPRVVALLGSLVDAAVRIGRAYAPVGSVVVGILRAIAEALDAIPLPVLTGLVIGITAYRAALLLAAGAQAILGSGLVTGIARMITYKTVTDAAGVSTTLAQRAITGASGAIGGPFVLALTAAVATIGFFVAQNQKAKAAAEAARSSLQDFGSAFKDGVTPAALDSARAILANNKELRGIVEQTERAGIATSTLIKGLNGDRDARNEVVASLDAQIAAAKEQAKIYAGLGPGQQQNADAASRHAERLQKLKDGFVASNDAAAESARLTGNLAAEQQKANDVFDGAPETVRKLADAYKTLSSETATAADKASALKQAEDALFGAARTQDEAVEAQAKAVRDTNALFAERGKITDKGSKSLDVNTEAGTKLRDSLKDQLNALNATFRANVAAGQSIDAATKKHDEEVAALKKKAIQQGVNKDAVQKLIDIYGLVPTSAQTAVTITGLDATRNQLDELLAYQYALRNGITVGEAKAKLNPNVTSAGGKGQSRSGNLAEGGPVVGPGTGTSDSVPAYERTTGARFALSNGEFVQPTASVDYYGQGFMEALRRRAIPRQAVRGYAAGGLIDEILSETLVYPYPTTTAMTRIPTRTEVAAAVAGRGGVPGNWPSSPSAQRGDSGVWRQVLALIRSGPGGGSFGNAYRPGDPKWHGCVPMDTLVLTRRGWISYHEVLVGIDETVGFNPASGRSEWTRIVGIHHYDDAELWTITAGEWAAEVTPGHKWLTNDGLVETRDLTTGSRLRLSAPLAADVTGTGMSGADTHIAGVAWDGSRTAEVFCPTTELGTWTARQGNRVFLTGNSGRAVDWMGYNQDALATFLAAHRPLELIHRTRNRDYAYTRGANKGSFNNALMEAHRNHIHMALAAGGLVNSLPFGVYDTGGRLPTGLSLAYNGTGRPEVIRTEAQEQALGGWAGDVHVYLGTREITDIVDVRVERATNQIARSIRSGTRP